MGASFAVMLSWLREKLRYNPPESQWAVAIADDCIVTTDGTGAERALPLAELKAVIVATDDSGPWGDDVVFLLYGDGSEPVSVFPLEAAGCQEFVAWLSGHQGYRDREMAKAMASTAVTKFVVWSTQQ